ncbi:AlpA family phage regulatory protein [Aliiroseovarius sp. S2029]|uniref:helix-turn-helix transcriptional regulator n=1 Tax=Aliiroseovarius sp. S2029 TaxID=2936988 RepID=UPI0020C16D2F|nr:AlpA family phage regulatory protein [Aliiroseovarius sp. S2029]MCK8483948.1 AlpA family phage regulatory protein [Aliiroseovarius sp. S2029]
MEHKLISAAAVRDLCGGISDMTLWRWLNDPELDFPKPVYIGKRRYWREADMGEWLQARAAEAV